MLSNHDVIMKLLQIFVFLLLDKLHKVWVLLASAAFLFFYAISFVCTYVSRRVVHFIITRSKVQLLAAFICNNVVLFINKQMFYFCASLKKLR